MARKANPFTAIEKKIALLEGSVSKQEKVIKELKEIVRVEKEKEEGTETGKQGKGAMGGKPQKRSPGTKKATTKTKK